MIDDAIAKEKSKRLANEQGDEIKRVGQEEKIKREELRATNARAIKQADYDLLKESFNDPVVSKLQYMGLIGDLYESINFSSFQINHMGNDDPVAQIVSKFTKMAEDTA